jgi:hypothetical protein
VDAVELALVAVDDQLAWLQCDVCRGEVRRHVCSRKFILQPRVQFFHADAVSGGLLVGAIH